MTDLFAGTNASFALSAITQGLAHRAAGRLASRQSNLFANAVEQDMASFGRRSQQILKQGQQQRGVRAVQAAQEISRLNSAFSNSGFGGALAERLRTVANLKSAQDRQRISENTANQLEQQQQQVASRVSLFRNDMAGLQTPSTVELGAGLAGSWLNAKSGPTLGDLFKKLPEPYTNGPTTNPIDSIYIG